jgi:esterase
MPSSPDAPLAATPIAGGGPITRQLVMLHGIYGQGRNWQTIARKLTERRPEYACSLVDLPYHGHSPAGAHGATVRGLAADVDAWCGSRHVTPDAVLGHSFGGKVALALAERLASRPLQVWLIDASPEARRPAGSAWGMLDVVRGLPATFGRREEATTALMDHGYAAGVAQWMATNLDRDDGRFRWRLDFDAIELLLRDFFALDLWPVVEPPAPTHTVHVVRALGSSVITPDAVDRLERQQGAGVHVHHREGGHWIHAEAPDVIADLLAEHLP